MIQFGQKQFDVFKDRASSEFLDDMVLQVARFFPASIHDNPAQTRVRLSKAIDRAAAFGLVGKSDVCKFINLTCLLGEQFYRHQDLNWLTELLSGDAPDRMSIAYDILIRQLRLRDL